MRACARNGAHQVVKLALDGRQVVKNVGVVELQVVEHGGARPVVDEFAAFVEEGGVVFVRFDDEAFSQAQACGHAEVHRHATDQKTGLQSGRLQNPGEHGGGGGFAVGARHGDDVPALQHVFGQPLRAAGVGVSGVQNGFHQRKFRAAIGLAGAADHVAHHEHVGGQCQLVGTKALDQFNAEGAQLVAHGWIDAAVAAGNPVTGCARQRCQTAHEGAANTENVNVHGWILGGRHPERNAGKMAVDECREIRNCRRCRPPGGGGGA